MLSCQKRKSSLDDLIRKPYPGVYNFHEEELAYKKIKNELSQILQENTRKAEDVVWLSGTTLPKVDKTKTVDYFDDGNDKLDNFCKVQDREVEIVHKKTENELSQILQENVMKAENDVIWVSGTNLPKVDKAKTVIDIEDGNEKQESDNSYFNHKILTFSDLCDEGYDFWGNSSTESRTEYRSEKRELPFYTEVQNEGCEIQDFDFSKFVETHFETSNTYIEEAAQLQNITEINSNTDKLPSIGSTYSLLQPYTDWLKSLTTTDNASNSIDVTTTNLSDVNLNSHTDAVSMEIRDTSEVQRKTDEPSAIQGQDGNILRFNRWEDIPEEVRNLNMTFFDSNKTTEAASANKTKSKNCIHSRPVRDDYREWEDNLETELIERAVSKKFVPSEIRKKIRSENARLAKNHVNRESLDERSQSDMTCFDSNKITETASAIKTQLKICNIRDKDIKEFLIQSSTIQSQPVQDVFLEWEDNLEAELIERAGGKKFVRNAIRKRITSENARLAIAHEDGDSVERSQAPSSTKNAKCALDERRNLERIATGFRTFERNPSLLPDKSKQIRSASPVGNSQFFVSDVVTSEDSIDTYNDQVIISCFDQVQDEIEPNTYLAPPVDKKRNPTLASRNKKYEESISSLIQAAHKKLAETKVQNRLNGTVVVGPSANGFGSKTQGPTMSSENVNFCQSETVKKSESNPLYLILPDNFDISSLQTNNSNNQLFLVIDNTTLSDHKTYLASAAVGNSDNILPQTAFINPTFSSGSSQLTTSVSLQSTHCVKNPEKSSLTEPQPKFSEVIPKASLSKSSIKTLQGNGLDSLFPSIYQQKSDHSAIINSSRVLSSNLLESEKCKLLSRQIITGNKPTSSPTVLKNIALGKDKNAIQQTSVPLKMDNLICDPSMPMFAENCQFKDDSIDSGIDTSFSQRTYSSQGQTLAEETSSSTSVTPLVNLYIPLSFFNNQTQNMIKTPVTVTSVNSTTDSIVANHSDSLPIHETNIPFSAVSSATATTVIPPNAMPSGTSSSRTITSDTSSTAGASNAMISLIPLCLTSSSNTSVASVPKKIVPRDFNSPMDASLSTNQCKGSRLTGRVKKEGRKTVRELLREKYEKVLEQTIACGQMSNPRSSFDLRSNNNTVKSVRVRHSSVAKPVIAPKVVVKPSICFLSKDCSVIENVTAPNMAEYKPRIRPNIMVLPSATKVASTQDPAYATTLTSTQVYSDKGQGYIQTVVADPAIEIPMLPPFKFGRVNSKEHRTRHFELRCLQIGSFKVQDYVDHRGKIKSKVKVVFTKRQLLYEFPASRCNIDYPSTSLETAQMFQISVPFKIIAAMDIDARSAIFRVNSAPIIYVGKVGRRKGVITCSKPINVASISDVILEDIQSYPIHKVILKKRQSTKLKMYLWNFDKRFNILSTISIHEKHHTTSNNLLPTFEDELELTDVRKLINKTRKGSVRRLPAWDSRSPPDDSQTIPEEEDELLRSSVHVCSCRISCKSVRCSCVKAAKSCNAGRSTCLCTNCDNPLSILKLLGINLDFALLDSCLFQNVYQIKSFEMYLRREIRLSCCNYVAKVQECIPGTVLCPNVDCNIMIQYSWCRGVVCYPERNPRNHCSYCGWCCFSSGKHCLKCNKCYTTGPKIKSCPSCSESDETTLNAPKDDNNESSISETEVSEMINLEVSVQLQNSYIEETCFEEMNSENNLNFSEEMSGQNRKETLQEYLSHTIFMP